MGILRVMSVLSMKSGLPEDDVVNTWHCITPGEVTSAEAVVATDALSTFYAAIGSKLGAQVSIAANAHTHKSYAVESSGPGAADDDLVGPLTQVPFTIGAVSSTASPAEVAVCLSMTAFGAGLVNEEEGNTRPKARYRGRVYIGPVSEGVDTLEATTSISRPNMTDMQAILDAAVTMAETINNEAGMALCVYSRADNLGRSVESFHIDNAWDTVRSRGQKPTARITATVTP